MHTLNANVRGLFKCFVIVKNSIKSNNSKNSFNSNYSNFLNNSKDSTTLPGGTTTNGTYKKTWRKISKNIKKILLIDNKILLS